MLLVAGVVCRLEAGGHWTVAAAVGARPDMGRTALLAIPTGCGVLNPDADPLPAELILLFGSNVAGGRVAMPKGFEAVVKCNAGAV